MLRNMVSEPVIGSPKSYHPAVTGGGYGHTARASLRRFGQDAALVFVEKKKKRDDGKENLATSPLG